MNIIDRKIVLNLNGNWCPISVKTVKDTFVAMMGGNSDNPPVKALDIIYPVDENGEFDFNQQPSMIPVTWLEWISLPIYEHHFVINTSKVRIRVPSVVIAINYKHIPKRKLRPSKGVLFEMQKGICGLSGKKISLKQANLEHKIPRSLGGKDTFENLMVADKDLNSARGNKPYEDLNIKPLFNHKQPADIPVSFTFRERAHSDWKWFMMDN